MRAFGGVTTKTQREIAREQGVHESTISRRRHAGQPLEGPAKNNTLAGRVATGRASLPILPAEGPMPVGQLVAAARIARSLSQRELAGLAGVSQSTVSDVERGAVVTASALQAVTTAVGVTIDAGTSVPTGAARKKKRVTV